MAPFCFICQICVVITLQSSHSRNNPRYSTLVPQQPSQSCVVVNKPYLSTPNLQHESCGDREYRVAPSYKLVYINPSIVITATNLTSPVITSRTHLVEVEHLLWNQLRGELRCVSTTNCMSYNKAPQDLILLKLLSHFQTHQNICYMVKLNVVYISDYISLVSHILSYILHGWFPFSKTPYKVGPPLCPMYDSSVDKHN